MQDNTVAHSFIFKNDADEWMKCLISSAAVSKVFFPVPLHEHQITFTATYQVNAVARTRR